MGGEEGPFGVFEVDVRSALYLHIQNAHFHFCRHDSAIGILLRGHD